MNSFDYYIIFSIGIITICATITSYKLRNKLKHMQGMVLTMAIAMNIGLTSGVFLGSLLMGNLFYSTVISIAVGFIIGLFIGSSLGVLSVVEGMMSGLMGGMMGAMLGDMIQSAQSAILLNILLALSICSILLFFILSNSKDQKVSNKKWLLKPFLTLTFLASYLIFGQYLSANQSNSTAKEMQKRSQEKQTFEIATPGFKYTPSTLTLMKNQPVSFVLNNTDKIEHDIEIKSISIKKGKNTSHQHGNDADLHIHASANSKSEISFTPLENGKYEFYCTLPGHKEAGMIGTLIVS